MNLDYELFLLITLISIRHYQLYMVDTTNEINYDANYAVFYNLVYLWEILHGLDYYFRVEEENLPFNLYDILNMSTKIINGNYSLYCSIDSNNSLEKPIFKDSIYKIEVVAVFTIFILCCIKSME